MLSTQPELRTLYSIPLFLSLIFCFNTVYASESSDMLHYQDKLEKLQKSIAKIQRHLKGTKKQRSSVVTELNTLELEISKNALKLKALANKVHQAQQQKTALEDELKRLNKQLNTQRTLLSELIRSAYSAGASTKFKNATQSTRSCTSG